MAGQRGGAVRGSGASQVQDDLSVGDDLTVTDDVTIAGDLTVGGSSANGIVQIRKGAANEGQLQFMSDESGTQVRRFQIFLASNENLGIRCYDAAGATVATLTIGVANGNLILPAELEIDGALNHDGSTVGFFGVTPAVRPAAYTATNVVTDRAYDANATSVDELADVLGTLIADLRTMGLVQ